MESCLERRKKVLEEMAKKEKIHENGLIWDEDGVLRYKNSLFPVPNSKFVPEPGKEKKFLNPGYHSRNGTG